MPRETKKVEAGQNIEPRILSEMTADLGSAPTAPSGTPGEIAEPSIEKRMDILERGMERIIALESEMKTVIEVLSSGGAAQPSGVEPQGGPPSQRNELIQLLQLATKPKTDDFSSFSKEFMMDIVKASTAGLKSYYTRLGGALGDQEVAERGMSGANIAKEKTHVITGEK